MQLNHKQIHIFNRFDTILSKKMVIFIICKTFFKNNNIWQSNVKITRLNMSWVKFDVDPQDLQLGTLSKLQGHHSNRRLSENKENITQKREKFVLHPPLPSIFATKVIILLSIVSKFTENRTSERYFNIKNLVYLCLSVSQKW